MSFLKDAEELYEATRNILKRSGALKAAVQQAADVIGITYYELPKIHGTRFVSHRDRGYRRFVHLLPAIVKSFENYAAQAKNTDTKAKVFGLLTKFRSSKILNMCGAPDIFEKMQPASLVFKGEGLLAFEIRPTIDMAISELQGMVDNEDLVEVDSMLRFFQFKTGNDGKTVAAHEYCKAGHEQRKPENREYHTVKIEDITGFHDHSLATIGKKLKSIAVDVIDKLKTRFEDFNNSVFCSMKWLDPQFWLPSVDYGRDQHLTLYSHFKVVLDEAGYEPTKVEKDGSKSDLS